MGLIDLLPNSRLGLGGSKPEFGTLPKPPGSLHDTYSVDGKPKVTMVSLNGSAVLPQPSTLDESDPNNISKYKSRKGQRYIDNLPK